MSFNENVLRNRETLKIFNCPSIPEVLFSMPKFTKGFLVKFSRAICLHYMIHERMEDLDEVQLLEMAINFKELEKSFIIIFESALDGSLLIYWRLNGLKNIFSMTLSGEKNFLNFIKEFIFTSLEKGHNGKLT